MFTSVDDGQMPNLYFRNHMKNIGLTILPILPPHFLNHIGGLHMYVRFFIKYFKYRIGRIGKIDKGNGDKYLQLPILPIMTIICPTYSTLEEK